MPSATDPPADHRPYVFISYASADRARIMPLVDALTRAGVAVWIDREGIAGGENYGTVIGDAIKGAAAFVLMASAASLTSRNVKQEIALGWRFERPYLPLLLEGVSIPDDLAYWLEAAQWVEVPGKPEGEWLSQVLTALAPLGIAPKVAEQGERHLAGRERELTLLREKLAAAKEGRGGLVLIGGEAGVGKTALAEAAMRDAAGQGFVVLEGHCFDLAETPPYGPWIDLFLRLPRSTTTPLPEAFAVRGTVGTVPSQMALFAQVLDFLSALGNQRPITLLLDDLHWADLASLDLIRFLARSVADLPLLVLVTYRSDELTRRHPLSQLLPQLAREVRAARIDLARLDDAAARTLVDDRYGLPEADAARLVAYLQQRAEGNALFIGELLRSLEEGGVLAQDGDGWRLGDLAQAALPVPLRQVIDARLARLGEEAQRLLAVAAVIGQEVPFPVWQAVADVDERALVAAMESARDAHLIATTESGMRFAHALIREALYEGVVPPRRRAWHRAAGVALAGGRNPDPDAVANHFQRAGDPRAEGWLLRAGERAQAAYARLTAAERFDATLALMEARGADAGERGWLSLRLGLLLRYAEGGRALGYSESAERLAAEVGDARLGASARFSAGQVTTYGTDRRRGLQAMAAVVAALDALPAADDETRRRVEAMGIAVDIRHHRGTLALQLAIVGACDRALALAEGVVREMPAPPWPTLDTAFAPDAYVALGIAQATRGRPDAALDAWERSLAACRDIGDPGLLIWYIGGALFWTVLPYYADDPALRRRLMREMAEARGGASAATADLVRLHLGDIMVLAVEGGWDEALRLLEAMRAQPGGWLTALDSATLWGPLVLAREGAGAALRLVEAALPEGPGTRWGEDLFLHVGVTQRLAAAAELAVGDLPRAREWLEAQDRWLAWAGAVRGRSEEAALWAQYHRQAGDVGLARAHAERALTHASDPRQPLALLAADRLLGELDTDAGRYEDAGHHLAASLAIADACQAPYERALTLLAMAESRVATGAPEAAKALLNEVQSICEPLGAKPTLARADGLAASLTSG